MLSVAATYVFTMVLPYIKIGDVGSTIERNYDPCQEFFAIVFEHTVANGCKTWLAIKLCTVFSKQTR